MVWRLTTQKFSGEAVPKKFPKWDSRIQIRIRIHTGEKLQNTQAESSNWMAKIINYWYNYDVTGDFFLHWSSCTKKMLRQNCNIKKITLTNICRSNGEIQVLQEVWERARQLGLSYMIIFSSTGLVDLHAMWGATWHVLLGRKGAARVSIHLLPDPASIDEMLQ